MHNSQEITYHLFLYSFAIAYYIRLLYDWSFHLCHYITYIGYFIVLCLFLLWHSSYGVVLYYSQKRFSFSLKVSLSQPCSSFLVWNVTCLSLEMSIQLFFFHLCFLVIFVELILVLSVFVLVAVIRVLPHFLYNLRVFVSMYRRYR